MADSGDWTDQALEAVSNARKPLILTGAGMSAESGIPTFRDALTGYWARYDPEELATPEAFAANPALVWRWYEERRTGIRETAPHEGHFALAQLEARWPELVIATQNVDGFHQLAGSSDVIELHGNIMRSICSKTGKEIPPDYLERRAGEPPRSPHDQDGLARPAVVWFGEGLPEDALVRAWRLASETDLLLSIGTSSLVYPAASLPSTAQDAGATVIEINPNRTPLSPLANHCIRRGAGDALTTLRDSLLSKSND